MASDTHNGQTNMVTGTPLDPVYQTTGYAQLAEPYRDKGEIKFYNPHTKRLESPHTLNTKEENTLGLPQGYVERKKLRLWEFFFNYFPLAWLEVYKVAELGNKQHDIGENLSWDRSKSVDQRNTAFRHLFDYGTGTTMDTDGAYHLAKAIWRLMAQLQLDVEQDKNKKNA